MRATSPTRQSDSTAGAFPAVSRLFEDFLNTYPFRTLTYERGDTWKPAVDILEKDGNLVIRADMPGVTEKDIDLKLEGNLLTLKGERKPEPGEDRNSYYLAESFHGTFARSFTLPETVDSEKIKADYKNGILIVTIPQKPEVKPKTIPVSAK
jgi:HSP20 family protein